MRPDEAERMLREARRWDQEGLLREGALARLEAEYTAPEGEGGELGMGQAALLGLAGAVLGAAALAFVFFLDVRAQAASLLLLALGLGAVAGGLTLARQPGREGLGDGLLVTALVCVAAASARAMEGFHDSGPGTAVQLVSLAVAGSLAWLTGRRDMVPAAATVVFHVVLPLLLFQVTRDLSGDEETASLLWFAATSLVLVGVVTAGRVLDRPWLPAVQAVCTAGLAVATLALSFAVVEPDFRGGHELVLALPQLAVLGAGLALRERGLVAGAALVLSADAIAFAFDVGGLLLGVSTLLAVAGALVALAWALRRR